MIYLPALYSLASAIAVVIELAHRHFVTAFFVAFMSAAAVIGGGELKAVLTLGKPLQKLGRFIYAAVLIVIALYLSGTEVNLYYAKLPGLYWVIAGLAVGFLWGPSNMPRVLQRR